MEDKILINFFTDGKLTKVTANYIMKGVVIQKEENFDAIAVWPSHGRKNAIKGINMRNPTIVVSLPCDCLVDSTIVRIFPQTPYRETDLRRYGCRTTSRFRAAEVLR